MATKYVLNHKKEFEIFLKIEKVLKKTSSPVMNKFANEETSIWLKTAKKYVEKNGKVIEMGCGSGRVIGKLTTAGFCTYGFDINKLFVNYCKKNGLNAFQMDATKTVPKKHNAKYKMACLAINLLFNFPEKIRKKWISSAYDLLSDNGILLMTVYADNKFSRTTIKERVKYYKDVIMAPKGYSVTFFDNKKRRGIHLCDKSKKECWSSDWVSKNELLKEVNSWKGFKLISIKPMKCGIAWILLLTKKQQNRLALLC
jgi:SAM-dependent methyltransferase